MTGNGKRYSDWEQPIPASYIIPAVNAEMLRLESCVTTTFDVEIGLILLSEKKILCWYVCTEFAERKIRSVITRT